MAITYKDSRRRDSDSKRAGAGPLLAVIALVGGLYVFAPQSTAMLEGVVSTVLALPRF